MKYVFIIIATFQLLNCGISEDKYNSLAFNNQELKDSIKALSDELNELKYGAATILQRANLKIDNNEYSEAKTLLENILDKYTSSKETDQAKVLLGEIIPKIEEQKFLLLEKQNSKELVEEYLSEYPNGRFVNEANKLLIKYEVNETFATESYKSLPDFFKEEDNEQGVTSTISTIKVENNTESSITLFFSGPDQTKIELPKEISKIFHLSNGSYRIVALVDGNEKYAREDYFEGNYEVTYVGTRTQSSSSYPNDNYQSNNNRNNKNSYNYSSNKYYNNRTTNYSNRVGAICCDGTRSYATGRGACSHHGGVCQWLYE
jgi:outer membrane murein-binding lipoprotein Lpp